MIIPVIIIAICILIIIGLIECILSKNAELSEKGNTISELNFEKMNAEFEVSYYKEELEKHGFPAHDPHKEDYSYLDKETALLTFLAYLGFRFTGEIRDLRELKAGTKGDFKIMPSTGDIYVYGIDEEGINWTQVTYKDFNTIEDGWGD